MDRTAVVERLRGLLPTLRELGVTELKLFGSTARGDQGPNSDVDLIVRLPRPDYGLYCAVASLIEDTLDTNVDLIMEEAIKPNYKAAILREALPIA